FAVPLFCAVNRRKVEKYLPLFMIILGIATIFQSFRELSMLVPCYGIPGNRNWNAALIAATLPFLVYNVFSLRYRFLYFIAILIMLGGIFLLFYCESKAVFLALIISAATIFMTRYWRKWTWFFWLRAGVFLIIVSSLLLVIFKGSIFNILKEDQRLFLWSGVLGLIKQHLWIGCGPEFFESAYAPHIPVDYYLGQLVSVRHPHSHNHFLQFAATMGIPALVAWSSVILFAVVKNLHMAVGKRKRKLKLYLFVFILLFVHAMLDIIVLSWPLGCIFLVVLGILIGRAVEGSAFKEILPVKYIMLLCCLIGLGFAGLLFQYLYQNFVSSKHYRNARLMFDQKNFNSAFAEIEKSLAAKQTPQNTYMAGRIALYNLKKPLLCLKFLDQLAALGIENFDHNNQLRAKALAASGRLPESLFYFAREQQNFPLSCVNLYYYRLVLRKLGRKAQADAIDRHLKNLLKLKGFSESSLPALLKDPHMDLRFIEANTR
ncbi:MAG: O-antigen ligase family protein, partial [Victivallaceae bacterium]|nr:O-antigen ligase family protein [Victivallaceae bacterium]